MASEDKRAQQEFRSYTTDYYKLHFFEVPTGVKFVLVTKKTKADLTPYLELLYTTVYIPYVSRNVFYKPGTPIDCQLFKQELIRSLDELQIQP